MQKQLLILLFFTSIIVTSQEPVFSFSKNKQKEVLSFEHINNLIVIPVKINGQLLNFILDTGVKHTILFSSNLNEFEEEKAQELLLYGLNSKAPIQTFQVSVARFEIGSLISRNHKLLVFKDNVPFLSNVMGIHIDGIIGYSFFNSFQVKINYKSKKLKMTPFKKPPSKLKNSESLFPLVFIKEKPYINAEVNSIDEQQHKGLFLIDTGSSDALWMFDDDIVLKEGFYFEDFLGNGLTGSVFGKRSKVNEITIGKAALKNVKVAYPDNVSFTLDTQKRLGTIGGELLVRYRVTLDYKNKYMILKSSSKTNQEFYYNLSGIELHQNGFELIQTTVNQTSSLNEKKETGTNNPNYMIKFIKQKTISFVPKTEILNVREDSPADLAGILKGDQVLKINNKNIKNHNLDQVASFLNKKPGDLIKIKIKRNNTIKTFRFQLKKIL